MFNPASVLLFIFCVLLLNGCASSSLNTWYSSTEQLIENHHYQQAIERITAQVPIDQTLLLTVKNLADKQRKKQTQKIGRLIQNKQWGQARELLIRLNTRQPNLASFTTLNLLIDNAQIEEERLIATQRALLEAQLLDIQFIQQDLTDRIEHNRIDWFSPSNQLMTQKQRLAENLLHLSTQALFVKDYKNAQAAYKKAIELDRELGTGELTQAINAGLTHQYNKAINERQGSLINQLSLAISTQDFDYIIKVQEILSQPPFQGIEVERVLNRAIETRKENSNNLDLMAAKEYRKGNISLAVIQWQQALKLTPAEINIQEKLIRAKKVQLKLEKLTSAEASTLDK